MYEGKLKMKVFFFIIRNKIFAVIIITVKIVTGNKRMFLIESTIISDTNNMEILKLKMEKGIVFF